MSMQMIGNIGLAMTFVLFAALMGTVLVAIAAHIIPGIIKKMTPHIDEDKEILRGNMAVAHYFGRIAAATIIGISLVIAAAVIGGVIAGLHGWA